MTIGLKRVYDDPDPADGDRILVERLWPRGLSKARAKVQHWAKEVAPSTELRKWFDHDPARWQEFKQRYRAELDAKPDVVREFLARSRQKHVTFVFASREVHLNNAVALKEYLEQRAST